MPVSCFGPRILPSANLFLQFKWDLINYETHKFNIRHAKPTIDIGKPSVYPHLYTKPKRRQLELGRASLIQQHNRILMERIATIHRKGCWVDHKNYHAIKSRNTIQRQTEMTNIQYGNKIMLERLRDTHTVYNRKQLEDDYQMQRKFASLLVKYPNNWTQLLHKLTKERKNIREEYVYPRAGYRPKYGDGKDEVAKSKASGSPESNKSDSEKSSSSTKKSDSEKSSSSTKKSKSEKSSSSTKKSVQFEKRTSPGKKSA